jgi:hypothetical protein
MQFVAELDMTAPDVARNFLLLSELKRSPDTGCGWAAEGSEFVFW